MVARFRVMDRWFTCDDWKAALNEEKHGVTFREAGEIFDDMWGIMRKDLLHSQDEDRHTYLGCSRKGRLLRASFCYCDGGATIRLISARIANRKEWHAYYQQRR